MENWKHFGALLTGIAALLSASIPIASCIKEYKDNYIIQSSKVRNEVTVKRPVAIVSDSDGWVNLRRGPSIEAPIIIKIENGYKVYILDKINNWTKVETSLGDVGYIYSDRLIIQNE